MALVSEDKYVGDVVSEDGKHTKNINSRRSKGIGVCNEITTILWMRSHPFRYQGKADYVPAPYTDEREGCFNSKGFLGTS